MKRVVGFFLIVMAIAVLELGGCAKEQPSTGEDENFSNGSKIAETNVDEADVLPEVGENKTPTVSLENGLQSLKVLENLFTSVYPHNWQNAYAEYLNDIDFNPVHLRSIYIKDINSDDIPEIIIIYTGDGSNCEILSFADGNHEVMKLHDVEKIYYREDTFQLIVYSVDGFSSGKRDYYQVYDLIENNYERTLNFGVKVVADPDFNSDGEHDLYYTYTINDDFIGGEHQPENEIDEHQFNKLYLETESLKSGAELLQLTHGDLNGGFEAYIEETLFN